MSDKEKMRTSSSECNSNRDKIEELSFDGIANNIDKNNRLSESPFLLENEKRYISWRDNKLSNYSLEAENLCIQIKTLDGMTQEEKKAILDRCEKYNMAIYQVNAPNLTPDSLKKFAGEFDLIRLDEHYCNDNDGITALTVSDKNHKEGFVPYTDKALNWHTDGYYNAPDQKVYSILLHCQTPASVGGENWLMDHEIAYIRLREENPSYIKALMHGEAMTIPAHIENGKVVRAAQTGPVFSLYRNGQKLHMRFSQRKRNIIWRDDKATTEAVEFLNHILSDNKKDMLHVKLKAGQGILSNNILHNRSGFKNCEDRPRLIYRGRFFEPIS